MKILLVVDGECDHQHRRWLIGRVVPLAQEMCGMIDICTVEGAHQEGKLNLFLEDLEEDRQGEIKKIGLLSKGQISDVSKQYDLMVLGYPSAGGADLLDSKTVKIMKNSHCAVLLPRKLEYAENGMKFLVGIQISGRSCREVLRVAADWVSLWKGHLDSIYIHEEPDISHVEHELTALMNSVVQKESRGSALVYYNTQATDIMASVSQQYHCIVVGNRMHEGFSWFSSPFFKGLAESSNCDVFSLPTHQLK